jgi:hypothetical protein
VSRRGTGVVVAIVITAPLAAGVAYAARSGPGSAGPPSTGIAVGSVPVVRGELTQTVQISGELGYTGSYTIDHQGVPGVLTAAPSPGSAIGRGGILYRVADAPVRLLLGDIPAYRDFGYGMSDGPDVRQLERNLAAMGHDPGRHMTVDRHFSSATAAAIRRWEASWGRPRYRRTGRLTQGQVVFLPTSLRVTALPSRVGATVSPGTTVLTATTTTRAVIAQLDTSEAGNVHIGDRATVDLPDRDPVNGRVTAIGQAATLPAGSGGNTEPAQPGNSDAATIPVTMTIDLPADLALTHAPVTVEITTGSSREALLVPIAALLARPGGGYQVRLADGTAVPVEPGGFDEGSGRVEIVTGLSEGQSVEVPA